MTKEEFNRLAAWAFSPANPGYKLTVREAPAGDGVFDEQKEYAHVAPKYFTPETPDFVWHAYVRARGQATALCMALGLEDWLPGPDSTLRLLRYPPGATTAPHTDFDLFTLSLYRSHHSAFQHLGPEGGIGGSVLLDHARQISPGVHFGELMTEILGVPATRHATSPLTEWSYSAVFFVIPDHSLKLPSGATVGEWIKERVARSRKTV